jgi:phosphatidylserine/phosphatidylglycerophosphate/cardiolipin synthase-like enzyme
VNGLGALDRFKRTPFPDGYPANCRTFYAPIDNVHDALAELLNTAQHSIILAMFGFDDPVLATVLTRKLNQEHCFVQLTLDKSQAGGVHERKLLEQQNYPASSIAIGTSEHGAIMHLKMVIIDGVYVVTGSTNWSDSAETKQDNQMTVIADPYVAAEARSRIDAIHSSILARESSRDHAERSR